MSNEHSDCDDVTVVAGTILVFTLSPSYLYRLKCRAGPLFPMSDAQSDCDVTVVVGTILVFALPLTLLIPDFSIWDVIPKVQVIRFHVLSQYLTWPQANAILIGLLSLFFCLYLEIRKRNLDDMVEKVLTVSQVTDVTLDMERERQTAAMKVCVELLDSSAEHYEHLMLLRDELRRRERPHSVQLPPAIEPSDQM